jgi:hypothetical protein
MRISEVAEPYGAVERAGQAPVVHALNELFGHIDDAEY